jgi:hypothetical protein
VIHYPLQTGEEGDELMVRKTLALLVLALAIPGAALAAKPSKPASHSTANPTVMYVLKGTLWNYTAATSTTNGSIMINVTHSNYHGRALRDTNVSFAVSTGTALTLSNGSSIKNGTRGIVKFRASKNMTTSGLKAALATSQTTAFQVIG